MNGLVLSVLEYDVHLSRLCLWSDVKIDEKIIRILRPDDFLYGYSGILDVNR